MDGEREREGEEGRRERESSGERTARNVRQPEIGDQNQDQTHL